MAKHKSNVPAVTREAGLAARALSRLEKEAATVHAAETERRERGLQLVSSKSGLSALIRQGRITIQVEDDAFSVSIAD